MDSNFRYAGIDKYEYVNGIGIGATLYVQGCTHQCEGCHNPETWDKEGGDIFTYKDFVDLLDALKNEQITRFTISGGDPLDSNIDYLYKIARLFKEICKEKQLWLYTGYQFEDVINKRKYEPLLKLCDVVVDGEFNIQKKDLSLAFRGSNNQRIIDVPMSLQHKKTILWKDSNYGKNNQN